MDIMETFLWYLASLVAVTVVIIFHEFAHAFIAYKNGDPTAKFAGRMSLNPAKHFDGIGLLTFVVIGFGWAKPVPINPYNFRKYKRGCFWTAAAGILCNLLMALLFYPLYILIVKYVCTSAAFEGKYAAVFLENIFAFLFIYSLTFAIFNLLPLFPLDGFRIVDSFSKKKGKVYQFLLRNGPYILLGLIMVNMLAQYVPYLSYINLLKYLQYFAVNVVGKPIMLLWNNILL